MDNLSHSHHQTMVSKKSCYNGAAKTLYDDVFGGPPRFGAPTLSPRVEDYNEIFGGFHASSRVSSIPVLDLPVPNDDQEEVFFDVRSSLGFDYGEVFGGFSDGPDLAVSYEELMMMESIGASAGSSSDEAWTPADAEYLSEESDHSATNQCLSNGDSHESFDGSMEFNISYHKACQSTDEDMPHGATSVTQLLAVPGYSFVVDKATSLPKTEDGCPPLELSDDGHLNIDFTGEMLTGRHLKKSVSQPANGPVFRNDTRTSKGYVRNGSFPNESFVTISDLSLRTKPSELPPPSRPPPPLDVKMRDSGRSTPNCNSGSSEGKAGDSSPPYFDVEIDATSSAAASAAAIKEAMEKAQAKLKSAKVLMDRKRDGFQNHMKSSSQNVRKGKDGKVNKAADVSGGRKDEKEHGNYEREDNNLEFFIADERLMFTESTLLIPDPVEGKKRVNVGRKSYEENLGRYSLSSQESEKINGSGEWKEAGQFFELVRTNESRIAFDHVNDENVLDCNLSNVGRGKKEKKPTVEASKQQQENVKKVKAARADHEVEECPEKSKEACEWEENNGRSEASEVAHRHKRVDNKLQAAQGEFEREVSERKMRTNNRPVERGKKQTTVNDSRKQASVLNIQQTESNCDAKQTMKHIEREERPKANRCFEGQKYEMGQGEALEQKEGEKKLKAAHELVHSERRLKEEKDKRREVNEKKQKESHQREEKQSRLEALELEEKHKRWEENEKKQNEAHQREEKERRLREALEHQENERRLKEALEKEEIERKLQDTLEKEENERRQIEAVEQEENAKREKEVLERKENEKKIREAFEKEENDNRQREAHDRKENEKRILEELELEELKRMKENIELEDIEKLKEAYERVETEKRDKDCFKPELCEKRRREVFVTEEIGMQQKDVYEQEEKAGLVEAQEGEEIETRLAKTFEFEELGDTSLEACNWEETELAVQYTDENDELESLNRVEEDFIALNVTAIVDDLKASLMAAGHGRNGEKLEATEEKVLGQIGSKPAVLRHSVNTVAVESVNVPIDGKSGLSDSTVKCSFDHGKNRFIKEDTGESPCPHDSVKKVAEAGWEIDRNNMEKTKGVSQMDYDPGNQGKKLAGERSKNLMQAQVAFNQESSRFNLTSNRMLRESIDTGRKLDVAQPATVEVKGSNYRTSQQVNANQGIETNIKNLNASHSLEEKEAERMKREHLLEMERLRKMEEEREREREREKDRMAVDRAALEARERAYGESREKAERAALERLTVEARQRAMTEARERLEKACAEAREKSLTDKSSIEARLRAERAAVERATAEARERAFEKVMAERAAYEARERFERSISEKFSAATRNSGMRPSASSSDLQDLQSQSSGLSAGSSYPYPSSYTGSYHAERSEGVEGESAQRCKARLERHRRTAERAAKALAEKNMRDLLAQREQAERHRLAETLDADVKRWSSGKEGNLRALLSTLQYILGADSGWQPIPLTEVITSAAVKRAYRKATLCVHPDKLQQRGATIQQKYVCEKVFDLLKEAWNKFNSEER